MASPLFTSQRVLLAVALLLLVNSQLPSGVGGLIGGVLRPVVDFAVLPVRAPVHQIAVNLREPGEDEASDSNGEPRTAEAYREEYEAALVTIDRQRQRINELVRTLEVLQGVRELDAPDTVPVAAKVASYTDAGPRAVLTIARGTRDGIAAGQTAVFKTSLVGRVVEPVGPSSADVELVTSHDAGLQVRVRQRSRETGAYTVYDNIRVSRGEPAGTFFAEVARDSPIRRGADVLLADAVHYPDARGRLLGVVQNVTEYPPDPELLKRLVIRPAVDLRFLREIAVLLPENDRPQDPGRSAVNSGGGGG
ncbi:MAG: rod shape-determining protein MreC [Planctomycetota bacterium]